MRLRIRSVTAKVDVRKVTGIKVEEKHFNFTKQTLSIESEHYKWFNQVKKLIPDEIRALHNAEYSVETSLRNLLNLEKIESAGDKLWENYVSKTSNSESTIENRLSNVNWVENNTPYKPLTKLHLSDAAIVKEIAVAIKTSKDHTLSGADNKLKKLDDLAKSCFWFGKNLF